MRTATASMVPGSWRLGKGVFDMPHFHHFTEPHEPFNALDRAIDALAQYVETQQEFYAQRQAAREEFLRDLDAMLNQMKGD